MVGKRHRRRRRKQQPAHQPESLRALGHSGQHHQRLSCSAARRVATMIARGQYSDKLFAAVNEVEDHLTRSATSPSLRRALSAAASALRQRLHGDAALCHVRVLMRNLRQRERELQSFPAFDPDPGTAPAHGGSMPSSPPGCARWMPAAPLDEFVLLERQLRRARRAYAALAQRPLSETLAARLLLCVGMHGARWRRAHLDALEAEESKAEATVVAPGLCVAATAWQWAKQVQYDAKVALARGATGRADACLCASERAFAWAAARAATLSAAAAAAAAAATATAAATFAQQMPSHALAMEKRIRGGTPARLGKLVARKGGGWHASCLSTGSAASLARDSLSSGGGASSDGGRCGGGGSKRGCTMSVEQLLSSSPLQFIGGLFMGITLHSSRHNTASPLSHTVVDTPQRAATATPNLEAAQASVVLSMRVLSPPRPGAAASAAMSASALHPNASPMIDQSVASAQFRSAQGFRPASATPVMVRKGHSPTAVSTTIAAIERASSHLGSHGFERAATAAATECTTKSLPSSPTHSSPARSRTRSPTRTLAPSLRPGGRKAQAWRLVGAEAAAKAAADAAVVALHAAAAVAVTVEAAAATCPPRLPLPPTAPARAAVVKALLGIPPLPVPMFVETALGTLPCPLPWQCDATSFDAGLSFYPYRTLSIFRRRLYEVRVSLVRDALACHCEPHAEWAAAMARMSAWVRSDAVPLDAIVVQACSNSGGGNESDVGSESTAVAEVVGAHESQAGGGGDLAHEQYIQWNSRSTARSAFAWAVHRIHQRQMQQETPSFELLPDRFLSLCEALLERSDERNGVSRTVLRRKGALAGALLLLQDVVVIRHPSTAQRVLRLIELLVHGHRPSIVSCCRDVTPALLSLHLACLASRTDTCDNDDAEIRGLLTSTLCFIAGLAKGGGGCGTRRLVLAESVATVSSAAPLAPPPEPHGTLAAATLMSRSPQSGGCVRTAAAALRQHPSQPTVLSSACEVIAHVAFELFLDARGIDAMAHARGDAAVANEAKPNEIVGGRAGYGCYDYFSEGAREYAELPAVVKAVQALQDAGTAHLCDLRADTEAAVHEFVRWDAMGATVSALQCTLAQLSDLGSAGEKHDALWVSVAHISCAAGCQLLFAECRKAADRLGLISALRLLHAAAEKAAGVAAGMVRADLSSRPANDRGRQDAQDVPGTGSPRAREKDAANHLRSGCISDWISPSHAAENAIARALRLCSHGDTAQPELCDNAGAPLWVTVP